MYADDTTVTCVDYVAWPLRYLAWLRSVTAPRLIGIELNPGPLSVVPQTRRPPRSVFQPRVTSANTPEAPEQPRSPPQLTEAPEQPRSPSQLIYVSPMFGSDTDDKCSSPRTAAIRPASDSSVTSDDELHPTVASIHDITTLELLPPPKFVGFLVSPAQQMPPPDHSATICAIDTMCLGEFSVISKELVDSLALPTKPFARTSRTATGALVKCLALAEFVLAAYINDQWHSYVVTALVWEVTSQPLLLCNAWALSSGLIDMVQRNDVRSLIYGHICFCWRNCDTLIQQMRDDAYDVYHVDVMAESDDDVVDLSAPLRIGDQDCSNLAPDAQLFASLFPSMTKALPFHAHPDLEKWKAHVVIEDLAKYSWPKCDLMDLKEDKFPLRAIPAIHGEFDKLIAQGFVEEISECPTSVVMKAQLVSKTKTEKRFCVNGSQQKKVLRVGVYPMPSIRNIFAFVSSFKWRAKIDLKWGYYNFEIDEPDRKWTVTIGAGRAVQWRKLVQGFASSGAFFQYAMTKMLGPDIAGVIAQVYLDDLIIVGNSEEECARNVMTVMTRLHKYNFRVNFAKCQFTPSSTIDFLGCSLVQNVVHPGPKVSAMLAKIKPFYLQPTPKSQRHHLHVFNGMCAYLLQHCPGLKQRLHLLYLAVASEPFQFGQPERLAFDECRTMLCNLDVYHLPSEETGYMMEVHSDASGGAGTRQDPGCWGAVLGQRKDIVQPVFAEGFELLQLDGGSFNERQAKWDILRKECWALYKALKSFRHYTFGRVIRIIVDSKVLMYMHRSAVPMIQRWYAFIQLQDFVMIHFSSEHNCFADALTRCTVLPPATRLVGIETNPGPPRIDVDISSDTSISSFGEPERFSGYDDIAAVATRAATSAAKPSRSRRAPQALDEFILTATPTAVMKKTARARSTANAASPPTAEITTTAQPPAPPVLHSLLRQDALPHAKSKTPKASKVVHVPTLASATVHSPTDPIDISPQLPRKGTTRPAANHSPPTEPLHPSCPPSIATDAPAIQPIRSFVSHDPTVQQPAGPPITLPAALQLRLREDLADTLLRQEFHTAQPPTTAPWPRFAHSPIFIEAQAALPPLNILCHQVEASSSCMFTALSLALDHFSHIENAAGHRYDNPCPSHHQDDCRSSVVNWMQHHRTKHCAIIDSCPFDYRHTLYSDHIFGVLCNVPRAIYHPTTWQTYLSLMDDNRTEPDELVLVCAAMCFRCELVVSLPDGSSRTITPPSPFRRCFLTFDPPTRHFNWSHRASDICAVPADCDIIDVFSVTFIELPLANAALDDIAVPSGLSDNIALAHTRLRQIAAAHCGHTGHPGIHATVAILFSQGIAWRGMTAQVTQYIGRCSTCILTRVRLNPAQPAVSTIRLSSRPLRRWHCDQTGKLAPCKFTGYERIITFVCESSGYVVLYGSRFGSALEIAIALVHLVGTYGQFDSLHSDNGGENDNFILRQFCKLTGIKHTNSVPCNPSSNGIVERGIQTVKRFLRTLIADGITDHNSWGFMLPIIQKAINSSPFGPLQVPPNSLIFASLYCPNDFVIPSFHEQRQRYDIDCDVADGNHYHPSANFIHRAAYFQQVVVSHKHEILDRAMSIATESPALQPTVVDVGSQVLIPWPSDRRPSSLHPFRRGPYIVLRRVGNVLSLQHVACPVPDGQAPSLRWSSTSQLFLIHVALENHEDDPSAAKTPTGIPFQRAIDCVLDHGPADDPLSPAQRLLSPTQRCEVERQLFTCRLFATAGTSDSANWVRKFRYHAIKHTLAFDSYIICHPALTGHQPISHMPATWDPRSIHTRPMHIPDIAAERALHVVDVPSDLSDPEIDD